MRSVRLLIHCVGRIRAKHSELNSIRVTPSLAAFVASLLLGVPFALGWASDPDGFPTPLKCVVTFAASIHVASLLGRMIALRLDGLAIRGVVLRVLLAYMIWSLAALVHWKADLLILKPFAILLSHLSFAYGLYLVGYAMTVDPPAVRSDAAELHRTPTRPA